MAKIKMGTRKLDDGVTEIKNTSTGAKLHTTSVGMKVTQKKEPKPEPLKLIELDTIKVSRLIEMTVEDLKHSRILLLNGKKQEIVFIKQFNPKSRILTFNYGVKEINEMLQINETDLSDFFFTFMFNNIRNYIKMEWNATPENLPIISVEEAKIEIPNTIIINIR